MLGESRAPEVEVRGAAESAEVIAMVAAIADYRDETPSVGHPGFSPKLHLCGNPLTDDVILL